MHRQQVLKYRLGDRFVTACVRFQKKAVTPEASVYAGFSEA